MCGPFHDLFRDVERMRHRLRNRIAHIHRWVLTSHRSALDPKKHTHIISPFIFSQVYADGRKGLSITQEQKMLTLIAEWHHRMASFLSAEKTANDFNLHLVSGVK